MTPELLAKLERILDALEVLAYELPPSKMREVMEIVEELRE